MSVTPEGDNRWLAPNPTLIGGKDEALFKKKPQWVVDSEDPSSLYYAGLEFYGKRKKNSNSKKFGLSKSEIADRDKKVDKRGNVKTNFMPSLSRAFASLPGTSIKEDYSGNQLSEEEARTLESLFVRPVKDEILSTSLCGNGIEESYPGFPTKHGVMWGRKCSGNGPISNSNGNNGFNSNTNSNSNSNSNSIPLVDFESDGHTLNVHMGGMSELGRLAKGSESDALTRYPGQDSERFGMTATPVYLAGGGG